MKIDQLIEELEQVREEHGNLSVIIPSMEAATVVDLEVGDLEVDLIGEMNVKENRMY